MILKHSSVCLFNNFSHVTRVFKPRKHSESLLVLVQVLLGDYSTEFRSVDNPLEHVGYCPQVNPLWPRVTLQEHLEIYAAIKGLKGEDVPGIIKR